MVKRVSHCILFSQILILGIVYFHSFDRCLDIQAYLPQNSVDFSAGFTKEQIIKLNPSFTEISENEWFRSSEMHNTKLRFTEEKLTAIQLTFHSEQDLALYRNAHLNNQLMEEPQKPSKRVRDYS